MKWFLLAASFFLSTYLQAQTTPIWITNINLVNTTTGKIIPAQTIVITDSTIQSVTNYNAALKPSSSVTVINGTGKYIMPGMVDGHIHFFQSGGLYTRPDAIDLMKIYSYEKDQQWIKDNQDDLMRRYLACGITTVMDVGGPFSNFKIREDNNANKLAPNAYVTGPLISTYEPENLDKKDPPIIKVNNEEEARELVRKQVPYKPDFIKIWYIVLPGQSAEKTLPIVKATIDESHKHHLKVCVHATEYETAKLAVTAGCDILVHSVDDKILDPAFLQLLKTKNITYIPTCIVASKYDQAFTQVHKISLHELEYANPFMLGTLFDLQHISVREVGFDYRKLRSKYPVPSRLDSNILENLKLVSYAGINIVAGTDAGNIGTQHGASFYTELEAMKQSGMTNAQILKAATINAAKGFGKETAIGSIEKGKFANLLILNNNPIKNLSAVNDAVYIINRGKIIKKDTLLLVTPESLVQQQVNAYNARNMEAFLEPYSDSVQYSYANGVSTIGKKGIRDILEGSFKNEQSYMQIVNRTVAGNIVTDEILVTAEPFTAITTISTYTIVNGKIQKVHNTYRQ